MRQTFTLSIPQDALITSNRSAPIWRRSKTKDLMRALTREAAQWIPPCGSASIFVGIVKRTDGRYDPTNLTDTFKGCIDELVTLGVLEDDDHRHVMGPFLYHAGVDKRIPVKTIRALVTLTDYSPTPF